MLADFEGKKLDYWVTGYGTGGTFHGAGKAIKAARPDVKIVLAEPEDAGLLKSGIPTERKEDGEQSEAQEAVLLFLVSSAINQLLEAAVNNEKSDSYTATCAAGLAQRKACFVAARGGTASFDFERYLELLVADVRAGNHSIGAPAKEP